MYGGVKDISHNHATPYPANDVMTTESRLGEAAVAHGVSIGDRHALQATSSAGDRRWELLVGDTAARYTLAAITVAYVVLFTFASSLKYWWFGQGHDLVLHEQAIWNTVHGRVFEITGFVRPGRLFGYDPYLIELLVVPIYALLPSVHTLFAIQSLAIGLGGVAVFRIARDEGLAPVLALLAVLLFLALPTVQYTNLDAFRERSLGVCFFLWAMWAFRRRHWRTFLVFLVLLIMCRLEAALFASCFGLYALLHKRRDRWAWTPLGLGLGYFFIGNFVFVPLVNAGQPVSYVYEYFAPLGNSMGEVLSTVLTRPLYTAETTLGAADARYLVLLFLPLGFVPLLAPRELVFMLPIVGLNLLATKTQLADVRYWYSMLLAGPLILGTITGVRRLLELAGLARRPLLVAAPLLLCTMLANWITPNPLLSLLRHHEVPARRAVANELVAAIPPEARVAASSRIAPHLLRRYLYYYPLADASVLPSLDIVVADVNSDSFDDPSSRAQLEALRQSEEWELVLDQQGFEVFRRRFWDAN